MTSQTKKFIELSDILAVKCECRNPECKTTLILPIESGTGQVYSLLNPNNEVFDHCPNCGKAWAVFGDSSFAREIQRALQQLNRLNELQDKLGCSLTLEVKEEAKPNVG